MMAVTLDASNLGSETRAGPLLPSTQQPKARDWKEVLGPGERLWVSRGELGRQHTATLGDNPDGAAEP